MSYVNMSYVDRLYYNCVKGLESTSETTISFHQIVPSNMMKLYDLWKRYIQAKRMGNNSLKLTTVLFQLYRRKLTNGQ
jgi:hypothetical protein